MLAAGGAALIVARPGQGERAESPKPVIVRDAHGNCLAETLNNQSMTFAALVQEQLRNPSSFEHVRTVAGPVTNGRFPVQMTYRATNGFGAVDTAIAAGEVRVSDCRARVTATE